MVVVVSQYEAVCAEAAVLWTPVSALLTVVDECCSLIVCNLYPFSQTVAAGDVAVDDAVEQIDIGICTFHCSVA